MCFIGTCTYHPFILFVVSPCHFVRYKNKPTKSTGVVSLAVTVTRIIANYDRNMDNEGSEDDELQGGGQLPERLSSRR